MILALATKAKTYKKTPPWQKIADTIKRPHGSTIYARYQLLIGAPKKWPNEPSIPLPPPPKPRHHPQFADPSLEAKAKARRAF
ncbi:MAG: hypothetical protein C4523_02320 [Myxococcales bacterium]|nr:MAG: hypothetical protein C4523_02320 [Myxococcales bacterium]